MFNIGDRVVWNGHAATVESASWQNKYVLNVDIVGIFRNVDISELTLLA